MLEFLIKFQKTLCTSFKTCGGNYSNIFIHNCRKMNAKMLSTLEMFIISATTHSKKCMADNKWIIATQYHWSWITKWIKRQNSFIKIDFNMTKQKHIYVINCIGISPEVVKMNSVLRMTIFKEKWLSTDNQLLPTLITNYLCALMKSKSLFWWEHSCKGFSFY
jgi:hydroxymethylglutaryl-CoA reductase